MRMLRKKAHSGGPESGSDYGVVFRGDSVKISTINNYSCVHVYWGASHGASGLPAIGTQLCTAVQL